MHTLNKGFLLDYVFQNNILLPVRPSRHHSLRLTTNSQLPEVCFMSQTKFSVSLRNFTLLLKGIFLLRSLMNTKKKPSLLAETGFFVIHNYLYFGLICSRWRTPAPTKTTNWHRHSCMSFIIKCQSIT